MGTWLPVHDANFVKVYVLILSLCFTVACAPSASTGIHQQPGIALLVRQKFQAVKNDCVQAGNYPVYPAISVCCTSYWLPASMEELIKLGAGVIPTLRELSKSADVVESDLAISCIEII